MTALLSKRMTGLLPTTLWSPRLRHRPDGNQTVCFYDANDNLKSSPVWRVERCARFRGQRRLAESRCEYDGLDRCVPRTNCFRSRHAVAHRQREALTTFAYAPNDECVSVTTRSAIRRLTATTRMPAVSVTMLWATAERRYDAAPTRWLKSVRNSRCRRAAAGVLDHERL